MFFVWSGWGVLVIVLVFASSLLMNVLSLMLGGKGYWETHSWPFALAMFIAAASIFFVDRFHFNKPPRILVDEATGERVALKANNRFFFIPMRWWSLICVGVGVLVLVTHTIPG